MENEKFTNMVQKRVEALRITDLLREFGARWYWFVVSVAVCLVIAMISILRTAPVYMRTSTVMIDTQNKGQSMGNASMGNFGIATPKISMFNEASAMISRPNIQEIVRRLRLDINYTTDGRFHSETLYGTTLPINVVLLDMPEEDYGSFDLVFDESGNVILDRFTHQGEEVNKVSKGRFNSTLNSPLGRIAVIPNSAYLPREGKSLAGKRIHISKAPLKGAAETCWGIVKIETIKDSEVIRVDYYDVSTERAEDFLRVFFEVYNENWMKKKNDQAEKTTQFINERLNLIEADLGKVDSDISNFKSSHLVPDVGAAASMYMTQVDAASKSVQNLRNQEYMVRYIRNYLSNEGNRHQLLPTNSGIDNVNVSSQIDAYNTKMLERNSLVTYGGENNPLVAEIDNQLASMRRALISSLDNAMVALNTQISSQEGFGVKATSQIASNPHQAKYLMSVERQQKVKESEYMYLLQKRDETELSQAFTAYNCTIIDTPHGTNVPVTPRKSNTMLTALLVGLVIPAVVIFVRKNFDMRLRHREDLASCPIPMVGEIPLCDRPMRRRLFRKKRKDSTGTSECRIVVRERRRNTINEAFRVVRTNLEFMLDGKDHQVIAVTSANPNSGKTFITFNLATCLAIKGLRVVAVDLDLRKCSLSKYVGTPHLGVSNYLAKQASLNEIIVHDACHSHIDVIPVGSVPPNPTELLFSPRMREMFDRLRQDYDFVFVDCPPIAIVADADIINRYADMTLFVIRAGLFDKRALPDVEKLYEENKYVNMAVLLNGTEGSNIYYRSRYGSRYYSDQSLYTVNDDSDEEDPSAVSPHSNKAK